MMEHALNHRTQEKRLVDLSQFQSQKVKVLGQSVLGQPELKREALPQTNKHQQEQEQQQQQRRQRSMLMSISLL